MNEINIEPGNFLTMILVVVLVIELVNRKLKVGLLGIYLPQTQFFNMLLVEVDL